MLDERDDGGLATATGTHEGDRLADRDGEGDVLENGGVETRGIREGNVGEGDVAVVTLLLIARAASSSLGRLMMPTMFLAARCASTTEGV